VAAEETTDSHVICRWPAKRQSTIHVCTEKFELQEQRTQSAADTSLCPLAFAATEADGGLPPSPAHSMIVSYTGC
jgi:hypothetical protein